MSGTLPVDPGQSGLTINSNFSVIRNTSVSGIVTTTRLPGHYWSFAVNYPSLDRTEFGTVMAFLNSQEGFDTFTFTPTKYKDAGGAATTLKSTHTGSINTDLTVNEPTAGYGIGDTSIDFTSNFTTPTYYNFSSDGYFLQAGDFIKFSGHNKVYQVTNNVQLDAAGAGTINISPRLQADISGSDTIIYTDVAWTVITGDDTVTGEASVGDTHSIGFDLREKP